jgi:hypothetical protein
MIDPLGNFDWASLYSAYDARCRGFRPESPHLRIFGSDRPDSDRALYYGLINKFDGNHKDLAADAVGAYEALLYWKLYSQPAARSNIERWRHHVLEPLHELVAGLPVSIERHPSKIVDLVNQIGESRVYGMMSPTALAVRTTFLHFLFPSVVPMLDRMVLEAVGVFDKKAGKKSSTLQTYLPFAWGLADRYRRQIVRFKNETPLRVIDMALWVTRGS